MVRYLVCVENNKDTNSLLKSLDIIVATNMIAASWRETSATIIQNCFHKAGFKHHAVDSAPVTEDPLPRPSPEVWNRVQKWIGEVEFDEYAASEPDGATECQPTMYLVGKLRISLSLSSYLVSSTGARVLISQGMTAVVHGC